MTNLGNKILIILKNNPKGLKAKDIADKLGVSRREVNQFLYYDQTEFVVTSAYTWVKKGGTTTASQPAIDPVLAKLKNRSNAKVFTSRYFNSLANWSVCNSHSDGNYKGTYKTKTGNLIYYDSKPELQLLQYLEKNKLAVEIGSQNLAIPYDTAFREDLNYYVDFVVLKNDGHIAFIEVKSIMAMSNHSNIEKYKGLKAYCESHGYEYMMIAPDHNYMTFDELATLKVPAKLSSRIMSYLSDLIGEEGEILLENSDVQVLYEEFENQFSSKKEFELYLHAFVIQKGWYNKYQNGFMVYEKPIYSI